MAVALGSCWQVQPADPDGGVQEYSPDLFTIRSALTVALAPVWVSLNARPLGGLTAYTTVAGEAPVDMYVASKVVPSPDFSFVVNSLMAARLADTVCSTFETAPMTEQPDSPKPPSRNAAATRPVLRRWPATEAARSVRAVTALPSRATPRCERVRN